MIDVGDLSGVRILLKSAGEGLGGAIIRMRVEIMQEQEKPVVMVLLKPGVSQTGSILGAAYTQLGRRERAVEAFERALTAEETPRAHFNLGTAYEHSGLVEKAEEHFRLALQMDSSYRAAGEGLKRLENMTRAVPQPASPAPGAVERTVAVSPVGMMPGENAISPQEEQIRRAAEARRMEAEGQAR